MAFRTVNSEDLTLLDGPAQFDREGRHAEVTSVQELRRSSHA